MKDAVARDDPAAMEREIGDLLFAVTNLCRQTGVDPEHALRTACRRFRKRFSRLCAVQDPGVFESLARMEALWETAKDDERHECDEHERR